MPETLNQYLVNHIIEEKSWNNYSFKMLVVRRSRKKETQKELFGNMAKLKNHSDQPVTNAGTDGDVKLCEPNLKGDWANLFLLLLLYIMQGLPLGISGAIPLLIQSKKNTTYADQAIFTIAYYPFSMKILWAPIVDALYVRKFGKRKSWLVPTQYLIGIILTLVSWEINDLLPESGKPNIIMLACVFFTTSFLAATQDIAVDGWALTMLKKNNVGYAAICNAVGQIIGIILGNLPLILLTSEEFCNKYLRITPVHGEGGILTLKTILGGWGMLFIMVTTLVAVFKKEKDCTLEDNHLKVNVFQSYKLLWYILKLPYVQLLAIVLLTVKIGFAPANTSIVAFKLIDAGVSKDIITFIDSSMNVINIVLPIVIAKFVSGPKTMNVFLHTTIFRLPMNIISAILIFYTPYILLRDNGTVQMPSFYLVILAVVFLLQNVISYTMFVALQSFFAQICDPRFGGTYMTLLNTLHNIGNSWTTTFALALVDMLTFKICSHDPLKTCDGNQGKSNFLVDGYYVEAFLCTVVGIVWYFIFRKKIKSLQTYTASDWLVNLKNPGTGNVNKAYAEEEFNH